VDVSRTSASLSNVFAIAAITTKRQAVPRRMVVPGSTNYNTEIRTRSTAASGNTTFTRMFRGLLVPHHSGSRLAAMFSSSRSQKSCPPSPSPSHRWLCHAEGPHRHQQEENRDNLAHYHRSASQPRIDNAAGVSTQHHAGGNRHAPRSTCDRPCARPPLTPDANPNASRRLPSFRP
jgi:hypothetical protein